MSVFNIFPRPTPTQIAKRELVQADAGIAECELGIFLAHKQLTYYENMKRYHVERRERLKDLLPEALGVAEAANKVHRHVEGVSHV